MRKNHTMRWTGMIAVVALLAACGQRSDLIECDGEVELRGNARFCVVDEFEQPEPEPDPVLTPEPELEQPEPSPHRPEPVPEPISEPEPTPDPVPEPDPEPVTPIDIEEGYATDSRGYPVPRHARSFVQIVHAGDRACLIDEFADLYCWDVSFDEAQDIARPSRIAPIRSGVDHVAMGDGLMCVLESNRHIVNCLDRNEDWHESVFASRSRFEQLSVNSEGNLLCVIDMYSAGNVFCKQLVQGRGLYWDRSWLQPDGGDTFHDFDLANISENRTQSFAALQSDGRIVHHEGVRQGWYVTGYIEGDDLDPFVDVHHHFGYIAALTESGQVKLYTVRGVESTVLHAPSESFQKLYSTTCGLDRQSLVRCWARDPRLPIDGHQMITWVQHDEPVSISIDDVSRFCLIAQSGQIDCGYVTRTP